jgi:membrane-associated phospholipid phosphatase
MNAVRPSERLTAGFLVAFAGAALAGGELRVALGLAVLAGTTVFLARAGPREGAPALVRDFFPVAVVLVTYMLLQPAIEGVNPRRWDAFFAGLDDRHLAGLVQAWRGALGRASWFTDANYVAYVSYYVLPIAVAATVRTRGPEPFERAVFLVLLCFYASFAGYFLFPTSGPRLSPEDEVRLLGGGAVSGAVRAFLRTAELTKLDAFPSGHTAVALGCAAASARSFPRLLAPFAAWAAAIVFSTVYVHVHYAVDVVAGVALAALAMAVAGRLARAIGPAASS